MQLGKELGAGYADDEVTAGRAADTGLRAGGDARAPADPPAQAPDPEPANAG
jgi:hypothetical protein